MIRAVVRVIDLETTGFEATCGVVEIAAWDLIIEGDEIRKSPEFFDQSLVNPEMPIPPAASGAHHLIDEDVENVDIWANIAPYYMRSGAPSALCAHHIGFERQFITDDLTDGLPWICTWKCSMIAWPEAPGHSNQELRYWLRPKGLDRTIANVAHRASPDAYVTAFLLRELLAKFTVEELVDISSRPALLAKVNFGKHRGKAWTEVDRGYLQWVLRQPDMDENVTHTARHHLNKAR